MTLTIEPSHEVVNAHQEPAVAHIHFRNEAGMQRFIESNKRQIKAAYLQWTVDWEPLLSVTAAR